MEAATCGLPVVVFDCPYGPRNVMNDKNGFLIPYEDDDAYVTAVQQLMDDIALRKKIGKESQKDIVRFSQENVMKRWIHLFSCIICEDAYERQGERL